MSLILEALRKLEREKGAPEDRGVVVLGSAGGGGGRGPTGRAVLAALVAVALGALGAMAWQRLGRDAAPSGATAQTGAAPAPPALEAVPAPRATAPEPPREKATAAPRAEEPTEPAPGPAVAATPVAEPTPALRLQAITRRDGQPVALLNERLVREGDSFDGIRVVRIGETEVELETPDGSVVLRF